VPEQSDQTGIGSMPSDASGSAIILMFGDKMMHWEGTAHELLEQVNDRTPYEQRNRKDYPTDAKNMGMRLTRDLPLLLKAGLAVDRDRGSKQRTIRIDRVSSLGA
jgi:hypothetical protein